MLRSTVSPRFTTGLSVLLPLAMLAVACSDAPYGGQALIDTASTTASSATASTSGTSGSGGGLGAGGTGGSKSSAGSGGSTGGGGQGNAGGGGASGTISSGTLGVGGAGGLGGSGGSGGAAIDVTAPTVVSSTPLNKAMGQATDTSITATFSEAMAPLTINGTTFELTQDVTLPALPIAVAGTVTYAGETATFVPASPLALSTSYTATITTGATDVAGNPLATAYAWAFTTGGQPIGPAPVALGTAGKYAVLAESKIANAPISKITGDLGISPSAASFITGFALTKAGTHWTSAQVTGSLFAADNDPPTPINLTTAVADMMLAYTDAAGRPTPGFLNLSSGAIGGLTLAPGLYKWTSTVTIPSDVVISGAANDTWIFQISGDLTMSASKKMILDGGARAKNIVWQVAGMVDFGSTSHAEGVLLSKTAITLETGASINGRLLAQTAVNLASNTITVPAP